MTVDHCLLDHKMSSMVLKHESYMWWSTMKSVLRPKKKKKKRKGLGSGSQPTLAFRCRLYKISLKSMLKKNLEWCFRNTYESVQNYITILNWEIESNQNTLIAFRFRVRY